MSKQFADQFPITVLIEDLLKAFGEESFDDIQDKNPDVCSMESQAAYDEFLEENERWGDLDEDEAIKQAEEAGHKAEDACWNDRLSEWESNVIGHIERIFERHELTLVKVNHGTYAIKPYKGKTWEDAAYEVYDTEKGVGVDYDGLVDEDGNTGYPGLTTWLKDQHNIPKNYRQYIMRVWDRVLPRAEDVWGRM